MNNNDFSPAELKVWQEKLGCLGYTLLKNETGKYVIKAKEEVLQDNLEADHVMVIGQTLQNWWGELSKF